ncbi:uncharacterized protein JN550_003102 [Neoarthrinium moseri]|uniref:uncharacterized protein n=1 Tax=Neoarthrinium moseri TaxID=1658444 RepID=UPI001FDD60C7|nr:uncharacterized protein JN550_003102 [Neoarthrinium moseri]KAI1873833.1 hypothetical protein JN550_003102 [Neoarthrinium moseri]
MHLSLSNTYITPLLTNPRRRQQYHQQHLHIDPESFTPSTSSGTASKPQSSSQSKPADSSAKPTPPTAPRQKPAAYRESYNYSRGFEDTPKYYSGPD